MTERCCTPYTPAGPFDLYHSAFCPVKRNTKLTVAERKAWRTAEYSAAKERHPSSQPPRLADVVPLRKDEGYIDHWIDRDDDDGGMSL